ncbi:MAG: DNA polymerase IV [Alphaproteobacteria bacterium]|nr:DNA polymerase IV [Alphaproteobacteria bacterium]
MNAAPPSDAAEEARAAPAAHLCRDCFADWRAPIGEGSGSAACPACGSRRTIAHAELDRLNVAHIDCDAFYASVEKRDDPALVDKPVLIGGGRRGVVSAACYVARLYGCRSAMPMFKALAACPEAVVIRPDMEKYAAVGGQIRRMMLDVTPAVEPLSIDEAFLDLAGTERVHGGFPAKTLARLVSRIETEAGVTASIGLAPNKFLAKLASDLDKPRGFAVIGQAEAADFLAPRPVTAIFGVGKALGGKLAADGVRTIGDLRRFDREALMARYGAMGKRLHDFARGVDARTVDPGGGAKSVSNETTLDRDVSDADALKRILWRLCEKVSARLKKADIAGRTVTLKLKTADFKLRTRSHGLPAPTQLAETLYRTAAPLLDKEADGARFRLIGVGVSDLTDSADADPYDLADPDSAKRREVERAIDAVREKLGADALKKGRGWTPEP